MRRPNSDRKNALTSFQKSPLLFEVPLQVMKNLKINRLVIHIVSCILVLSLPVFFSPDLSASLDFISVPGFRRDFLAYFFLILFFYLNYWVLIPRFYFQKKYVLFALSVLGCLLFISLAPEQLIVHDDVQRYHPGMPFPFRPPGNFPFHGIGHHFFQFLIVLIFSLMLSINDRWKEAEQEKLNAELSFFKAQIKPHFLFNTLNSIYSLAIQKSSEVPKAIALFSEIIRYVTTEAHNNFVPLERELSYLSSYIALQKLRFEDTVNVTFFTNGITAGREISPLILITFVENAFKYGVNPEKKSEIKISIYMSASELCLAVFNNKVIDAAENRVESGMGIANVKKRLQLLYPSKHLLEINDDATSYSVLLKIDLQ